MSDAESQAASPIDVDSEAASPIDVDILCVHCGYNLRGLTSDGRCPECGGAIADSMRGELLRFADVEWLTKLRLGVALKLWAIGLAFVFGIGWGAFALVAGNTAAVVMSHFAISFSNRVLSLWGTWCITAPDPRLSLSEPSVTLRKVVRACAIAGVVGGAFSFAGAASGQLWFVAQAAGTIGWGATYVELFYCRRFARRVPEATLAKSTTFLIWAVPIYFGCVLAFVAVRFFVRGFPVGTGVVSAGFSWFGVIAGLFLFLWYVRLLTKYRKVFADAIVQAKVFVGQPVDSASVPDHHES